MDLAIPVENKSKEYYKVISIAQYEGSSNEEHTSILQTSGFE
jgi:hypothetical protein